MPIYTVTAPGFYDGKLYEPNGKRGTLHTPAPLDPVPSWLQPVQEVAKPEPVKAPRGKKTAEPVSFDNPGIETL